jgi:hypothetical protein
MRLDNLIGNASSRSSRDRAVRTEMPSWCATGRREGSISFGEYLLGGKDSVERTREPRVRDAMDDRLDDLGCGQSNVESSIDVHRELRFGPAKCRECRDGDQLALAKVKTGSAVHVANANSTM